MFQKPVHAVAALLIVSATTTEGLDFAPTPGSTVRKVLSEEVEWKLVSMTQRVGGQELTQDLPKMESTVERETVVVDTYAELGPGKPRLLKRKVERARGAVTGSIDAGVAAESFDFELESQLEGQALVFRWDPDGARYVCSLERGDGHAAALERLREDLDLRGLLPQEDVAVGASWEVEPAALLDVLAQGGDFERVPDGQPESDYVLLTPEDPLAAAMISLTEPEAKVALCETRARWVETRTEGEGALAIIDLDLQATIESNPTERLLQLFEHVGLDTEREAITLTVRFDLKGKGQLVWDLKARRFAAFDLDSEVDMVIAMSWTQDGTEIKSEFVLEGRHALSAETGD